MGSGASTARQAGKGFHLEDSGGSLWGEGPGTAEHEPGPRSPCRWDHEQHSYLLVRGAFCGDMPLETNIFCYCIFTVTYQNNKGLKSMK